MSASESFDVCPTEVVGAPVERVWERLTNPSFLAWTDTRVIEAPARPLRVGGRVLFSASLGLRVRWDVRALDPPHQITLEIALPFGMANHETVVLSRLDANRCRVTFN